MDVSSFSDSQLGLLMACALWGIASLQSFTYYRKFKSDALPMKAAVGVVWLSNTMYVTLEAANQYSIMQGNFRSSISLTALVFFALTQSVVQVIYAHRLHRLSNHLWIPFLCGVCAAYEFATIVLYAILVLNTNFTANQQKYQWILTSSYIVSPIVDVVITGTFCYLLRKDRQYITRKTARIIDRLVVWTIQSGLVTSLVAIVMVIMVFTLHNGGPFLAVAVMISPLYPVTLLSLLNARSQLRSMNEIVICEGCSISLETDPLGKPLPGKSIPFDASIGPQATDISDASSATPKTGLEPDLGV